jgi:hypothetical protein
MAWVSHRGRWVWLGSLPPVRLQRTLLVRFGLGAGALTRRNPTHRLVPRA